MRTAYDEMSNEELQRFVKNNGIAFEVKRREYLMNKRFNMEFTFSFGFKINNTTQSDSIGGNKGMNRDSTFGLEYFLGSKYEKLDNFSIEIDLRKGINETYLNSKNASLSEFTYGLSSFWYPFNLPATIEKNVFFVGLGLRRGSVNAETTLENANYSIAVFPILHSGIRYNFKNQWGIRILGSLESNQLTIVDPNAQSSEFPRELIFSNFKIVGGLSYYF